MAHDDSLRPERLDELLAAFPQRTIGLLGDLFLDRYLELAPVRELSIETGLEAYQIERVRNSPGALGTVMNNLAALRVGRLVPVTVIGDDGHGYDLLRALRDMPVDRQHVVQRSDRLTPTYTKPLRPMPTRDTTAEPAWQELNRLDVRTRGPLSADARAELIEHLRAAYDTVDAWVVLDQVNEPEWGVIGSEVRSVLDELQRRHAEKLVLIDSRAHLGEFASGVWKGNDREVARATGCDPHDRAALVAAACRRADRSGRRVFCTLGEDGILVARRERPPTIVPACRVTGPIDIVGAGDAAMAALVASLSSGASDEDAARLANLAASITIRQIGTTGTATPEQLRIVSGTALAAGESLSAASPEPGATSGLRRDALA